MLAAIMFLMLTQVTDRIIRENNAWFKPFQFALSIAVFSWTMGWFTGELDAPVSVYLYSWTTVLLLGFEVVNIALHADRGKLSHYNDNSPLYSVLTILMRVAADVVTFWTGYIGLLFCVNDFPGLPGYYVLSFRLAIFLFVFFAFQGPTMGVQTVGGIEGGPALPIDSMPVFS